MKIYKVRLIQVKSCVKILKINPNIDTKTKL